VSDATVALLVALPWLLGPIVGVLRFRRSRELGDVPAAAPSPAPLVSVIVPARNERLHIDACLRSVLATTYPAAEVVVVDDQSTDGTGDIARQLAATDARVRVTATEPLPAGWFGKPWACTAGARAARGEILCFIDADTRHAPDLLARAVRTMLDDGTDMLSVVGHQELGSFWERVVQPQVFAALGVRYGSTERVNRSRRVTDKIANGQCILVRRATYDAIGGHGAVRDKVAEDLALAQRLFAAGARTRLVLGRAQLTTRMYTSLREIVRGWRKNIFAGGRDALPGGRLVRWLFPLVLVLPPLMVALPVPALIAALFGLGPSWLLAAAAIATGAQLVWWLLVYRWMDAPVIYAALFPLGGLVFLGIALQSIARGSRIRWKDREYGRP
jgi:chlorobactene glucosyltransferase